jgi:hypothetical protein
MGLFPKFLPPFDKYPKLASNERRSSVNLNEGRKRREPSPSAGHGDKSHLAQAAMAML